jgi:hypothetical protein
MSDRYAIHTAYLSLQSFFSFLKLSYRKTINVLVPMFLSEDCPFLAYVPCKAIYYTAGLCYPYILWILVNLKSSRPILPEACMK